MTVEQLLLLARAKLDSAEIPLEGRQLQPMDEDELERLMAELNKMLCP
jgi:hypothetical protein